ncbi:MAG TPA: DNA gyrase modulator, partial [Vicinamibacteria bacterium]|nr:DNA gyrase modulator [Vicinamibacteria bacterium]
MSDRARIPDDIAVPEMERLIGLALARGGQFADLYFEHQQSSSLFLEERIIRSASAGVTCGLGVRVVSGERTGYAYTDDLSWSAMARAAETAAYIASDSKTLPPESVSPRPVVRHYGERTIGGLSLAERILLVERAEQAARSYDPRVDKVMVSLSEEVKRVRIANSAGVLAEDTQPLFSIRVSVIALDKGLRREGSAGGGGRIGP